MSTLIGRLPGVTLKSARTPLGARAATAGSTQRRCPGALEDDVEGTVLPDHGGQVRVAGAGVAGAETLEQLTVAVRAPAAAEGGHLQAAQAQRKRGQQADGAGTSDQRASRLPEVQARLDLVGLAQRFRDARERLGEDGHRLQVVGHGHQVAGVGHHLLSHEAMCSADAGLDEDVVRGEVRAADAVVGAATGPADGDHHEPTDLDLARGTRTDLHDAAQRFVAQHQEVGALRRAAVLAADEVRVRAAQARRG